MFSRWESRAVVWDPGIEPEDAEVGMGTAGAGAEGTGTRGKFPY